MFEPERRLWRHPIVKGVVGVAVFVVVAEFVVFQIQPAFADISIPLTEHIIINLGDAPQWIIALVAAGGLWKAWGAERKATAAATASATAASAAVAAAAKAGAADTKIEAVSHQIDGLLADRDRAKVSEGEKKGKQAGADAAAQLAEGQAQGIAMERASVAAANPAPHVAPQPAAPPLEAPGPQVASNEPMPVADDRTATAAERVAQATERVAGAAEAEVKPTKGAP